MQAAEQADAPGALLDRDVPAGLGHALLQGEDIPGLSRSALNAVTAVSVRFRAKLKTVWPARAGGV